MTVPARRIGATSVHLSPITLGTMRLADRGLDARGVADLLLAAADLGVTALHSSSEYTSYAVFGDALAVARRARPDWRPAHVVKLAEPGFGQAHFEVDRFSAQLDRYRVDLDADRIDVVQWMVRHDLKDHQGRLAIIERDGGRIGAACSQARDRGALGAVVAFPYDASELDAELAAPWCDGFALYVNPVEPPDGSLLDRCVVAGRSVVGIRPLAAGSLIAEPGGGAWRDLAPSTAQAAVRFALLHPAVATTVVSTADPAHLAEIVHAADHAPSAALFHRVVGVTNDA